MTRPRDFQRKRVYDAERVAFTPFRAYTEQTKRRYVGSTDGTEHATYDMATMRARGFKGPLSGKRQPDGSIRWYKVSTRKVWRTDALRDLASCQAFVDEVRARFPGKFPRPIRCTPGKGARWATARTDSNGPYAEDTLTINLPLWARIPEVVLHELAHHATENELPSHGAEFCAEFLYLMTKTLGRGKGTALATAFRDGGVKVAVERWAR